LGIECQEGSTDATIQCKCPLSVDYETVNVADRTDFNCNAGIGPSITAIIQAATEDQIEVFIADKVAEILNIDLINRIANTMTFEIEASVEVRNLEVPLQEAIADFFGDDVAPDQVSLDFADRQKRQSFSSTVVATIEGSAGVLAGAFLACLISFLLALF